MTETLSNFPQTLQANLGIAGRELRPVYFQVIIQIPVQLNTVYASKKPDLLLPEQMPLSSQVSIIT
jgi:hypothetical protein